MTFTVTPRPKTDPRLEDDALVRGTGKFVNDPKLPNQAYAAFTRSPHASARIAAVEIAAISSSHCTKTPPYFGSSLRSISMIEDHGVIG